MAECSGDQCCLPKSTTVVESSSKSASARSAPKKKKRDDPFGLSLFTFVIIGIALALGVLSHFHFQRLLAKNVFEKEDQAVDSTATLRVDGARLLKTLDDLALVGALEGGAVARLAFSETERRARETVQGWMEAAGMSVRVDAAGNIIGRYDAVPGSNETAALAMGSHIDTVPEGGKYDGALGVVAAIEVVRILHDQAVRLRYPVEVIAFTDEEFSMLGSKAMGGLVNQSALEAYRNPRGPCISLAECLSAVGGNISQLSSARRTGRRELAAYIELHIEQGPVLEHLGLALGVVEGIAHTERYMVTVTGVANHAGTTPMSMRADALVAAAQLITYMSDSSHQKQVATVGMLSVWPNATNVVPGLVRFTIDVRDVSTAVVRDFVKKVQDKAESIAAGVPSLSIKFDHLSTQLGVPTSSLIQNAMKQAARSLRVGTHVMPSMAGHDAQNVGRSVPMGMIFVQSRGGFSHSHLEFSKPDHCEQGANLLLQTILRLESMGI
mmetsp:Transcript_32381/g.52365  ORF Transcript_32381/g.52365 Transcript_32381/m.52365 type:complete len:497 (+) Transcript_32381:3-1493(+)